MKLNGNTQVCVIATGDRQPGRTVVVIGPMGKISDGVVRETLQKSLLVNANAVKQSKNLLKSIIPGSPGRCAPRDDGVLQTFLSAVGDVGAVGDVVENWFKRHGIRTIMVNGCVRGILGIEPPDVPVWARVVSTSEMQAGEQVFVSDGTERVAGRA